MSRTIAEASRDARKRKAERMARYETALRSILKHANGHVGVPAYLAHIARAALGEEHPHD